MSAMPSSSVKRPWSVWCESTRVTMASPTINPTMAARLVPTTKPVRNATPFARGRPLRSTITVAVSTTGLMAATSA